MRKQALLLAFMRAALPKLASYKWVGCDDDGEFEGREFTITWGRWTIQFALGRHNRRLG